MNNITSQIAQNFLQQAMQNQQLVSNDKFQNALNMYRNHQSQNLREYANNLCQSYGITYEDAVNRLGRR